LNSFEICGVGTGKLGWSSFLRGKVQLQANQGLQQFVASNSKSKRPRK